MLHVGRPAVAADGDAHLGQHLVRPDRGGEEVLEEVLGLDRPGALRTDRLQLGAERQHHGRPVRSRVGVGQAPPDGPVVADLRIADHRRRLGEHGALLLDRGARLDGVVRGQGADHEVAALLPDPREAGHAPDVDQVLGLGEPELHHGDEAVAAREELGVVLVAGEQAHGLLDARHPVVLEARRVHDVAPSLA